MANAPIHFRIIARNFLALLVILMVSWVVGSCSIVQSATSQEQNQTLVDFPLQNRTKWTYSYIEYESITNNPSQITTASYLFSETIVDTRWIAPFFIAHVRHEEQLVKADPDWNLTDSSRPTEWWYIVRGGEVYQSFQPLDMNRIQTVTLPLAFEFPLEPGRSWCPFIYIKGKKVTDCTSSGKRTVAGQENQQTPAGNFSKCYKITEDVNSGGVTRWLCTGVGLVAEKYDHAGTRFGYQKTLVSYSKGSP
jgi:hypothetical protein